MITEPSAESWLTSPDPPPAWPSTVPQSKLRPGANPPYLIARPRLFTLIQEPQLAALTLVVAPAGSGKTSLLRSWVAETSLPYAWLSLDETDRDPVQFWLGMLAALEVLAPGCAEEILPPLRRPAGIPPAVNALVDNLGDRSAGEQVLVIDDVHLVDDVDAVWSSLAWFLQHAPDWLRVIVSSRRAVSLPTHRLRVRGQLHEVTFAELRFSAAEATALLARIAPNLPAKQAAQIARQSGGWAASIQLAALAARSSTSDSGADLPPGDSGHGYLQEYVLREVLGTEPQELVDVLLTTAIVERIPVGLGQVLSGRDDVADQLALARDRGLFVTQIEPTGCFEVHQLVREILLRLAEQRWPGRLPELHACAAQWYEAHGELLAALDHWVSAGRPRDALRLLCDQISTLYDAGHESVILRTIEAVPPAIAATDIDAMLAFAWCHLLVDRQRFLGAVDHAASWAGQEPELTPVQSARLTMLESMASTLRGDWLAGQATARRALLDFGPRWQDDYLGKFGWNMIARGVALDERWSDAGAEVRAAEAALTLAPERRIAFEGVRALGEALAGRPVDALRVVAGVRSSAEVANMTILRGELDIAEAIALREIGDVRAALPRLVEVSEIGRTPVSYAGLLARLEVSRARMDEGDLDAARVAFVQAAEAVEPGLPGRGSRDVLARQGCVLALAQGDHVEARAWADKLGDPFWAGICAARIHVAEGDHGAAATALAGLTPRCPRHQVTLQLLLARAGEATGQADHHLAAAVQLASANGMVATVAAEGPSIAEAIERIAWQIPDTWLDRLRRMTATTTVPQGLTSVELIEGLTARELEVVRLLPSRLSLREVADELGISMNTLKFHLKVIYRKLNCGSRAEAAELARSLTSPRRPLSQEWPGDTGSGAARR